MTGTEEGAELDRARALAEIDKLKAEAESLRRPQSVFATNWLPILTTIAGLVTALGGTGALITSCSQLDSAEVTRQKGVNDARQAELDARQHELDARDRLQKAESAERDVASQKAQLETENAVLRKQNDGLSTDIRNKAALIGQLKTLAATAYDVSKASPGVSLGTVFKKGLVYLQIGQENLRPVMTGFQSKLVGWGFAAPGVEYVEPLVTGRIFGPDGEVRYFRDSDASKAADLAQSASAYFAHACGGDPRFAASFVRTTKASAQFEIWTDMTCAKKTARPPA